MSKYNIFWCKNCWMPSTRPNITFDENGVCHACKWAEEKKTIDWETRQHYFRNKICDKYCRDIDGCDVTVPWSGGKDSIYVAYKMREFGLHPLLVTVLPDLETEIGEWNRKNMCKDFKKLEINLASDKYRELAREYFIKWGKVKHPWETAISASIINLAAEGRIPSLIVYGEEGGIEYGGTNKEHNKWKNPVDKKYLMNTYYMNHLDWKFPLDKDFEKVFFTQWSRFENWKPSLHANVSIMKGMRTEPVRSIGTFTSHSQLSDKLQDLHQYMVFCKFGFGRASADASIAIRDEWTNREESLEWIETYDGEFPNKYLNEYLEYLNMSMFQFTDVINAQRNKDITSNIDHIVFLKEWVARKRRRGTIVNDMNRDRFNYTRGA